MNKAYEESKDIISKLKDEEIKLKNRLKEIENTKIKILKILIGGSDDQ